MTPFTRFKKLIYVVLTFIPALGVGQTEKVIQTQFTQYSSQTLQEKLFVHTDRPFYLVGETIWFKVYAIDGASHQPLDLSKVAYVELLDRENNAVVQTKLSLADAKGNGAVVLPASLNSGYYMLRAYTNWMKNFSADYYFEKQLTIINPFGYLPVLSKDKKDTGYDVQFFPEGGALVENVESKVAFKVNSADGKGIDCIGAILNQKNDTVVRFSPLKFGIGNFVFTPAPGNTYRGIIKDQIGEVQSYPFPVAKPNGYVLRVSESGDKQLQVSVSTAGVSSQKLYILIHTRQATKYVDSQLLTSGKVTFYVDKTALGDGISHITIFDEEKRPVAERIYFKRPIQKLAIEASLDKKQYTTREKIDLTISTQSDLKTDLSVSVYMLDSLQTIDHLDITSYIWLSSDLKGTIETPQYYFENEGLEVDQAMDNLMLTHGWSRFKWDEVWKDPKQDYTFVPEYGGHFITGKVFQTKTGLPAKNMNVFLSAPDRYVQLFVAKSDSLGRIRFEVKNFSGAKDIIVQTDTRRDSIYRFEINSPFSEKISSRSLSFLTLDKSWQNQLLTHSINMQTNSVFFPRKSVSSSIIDSLGFYGKPHEKYFLDAYTRFPTVEEVMREYVPGVMVRKHKGKFHFYVFDKIRNTAPFDEDPLILLDGIPVFDTDKIMAFDPLKIKKLEVIDGRYFLGHLMFKGLVSYSTYKGDLAGFELDPHALVQTYEGMQNKREFYTPKYDTPAMKESRLPDFRNLLYWNPEVHTESDGKKKLDVYSSDQQGKYVVVIQGITSDGKTGYTYTAFDVKGAL
ncbi:hypothetical protein [Xanthocytophaga agilis]|uniref:Macroglobulin domain-containing protein n=1 Tax=Xanthocytophaga agilis TaxID=3048010 RepID=A0AAE3R1B8_9BACT|nr:hypothetical protein [Xanthocytophaga agilis]MDJ1499812.1 hypothetical protein [Xanthocytophaga agilis]